MNVRFKTAVSLTLVIGLAAASAACSKSEQPSPPPASNNNSNNNAKTETNANKKFTITMMDYRYGALPPLDGKGIQMMNEKFNVDWMPTYINRQDYEQKTSVTVASGDMPDILILENLMDANLSKWAKQGAFLPVDEYIQQYDTFKLMPPHVLKAVTVNGKIYGIPGYATSTYSLTPMIRQDWLDNLGLKMPANYEELKQVAIAFTKNDPDKNGKNDTYGMVMSEGINPQYHMGAYWDQLAWYNKDKNGNYIPGIISDARKEHVKWLADLYKEGAITKDFALINWAQAYKEFYSGKAGMFIGAVTGIAKDQVTGLLAIDPKAKLEPIPPFKAPDGSQGFTQSMGAGRVTLLNAKLKNEPEKVKRILEIMNFSRKFYPVDTRTPSNKDFDWFNGMENSGYKMVNGTPVNEPGEKGLAPSVYMPDLSAWAPSDKDNQFSKQYEVPLHRYLSETLEKMHANTKHYLGPDIGVSSPLKLEKEIPLIRLMYDEQTKLIVGKSPMSDWDKVVQKYMDEGGAAMIKEVNDGIKAAGNQGQWK